MARKSSESKQMAILHSKKKGKVKSFHGERKGDGWVSEIHHQRPKSKPGDMAEEPMDSDSHTTEAVHSSHGAMMQHIGNVIDDNEDTEDTNEADME